MYSNKASFASIRSVAAASITGSYTALGAVLAQPAVGIIVTNLTDGQVLVSIDGTNDHLVFGVSAVPVFVPISSLIPNKAAGDQFVLPASTQFYVKDGPTASTTGSFYLQVVQATRV